MEHFESIMRFLNIKGKEWEQISRAIRRRIRYFSNYFALAFHLPSSVFIIYFSSIYHFLIFPPSSLQPACHLFRLFFAIFFLSLLYSILPTPSLALSFFPTHFFSLVPRLTNTSPNRHFHKHVWQINTTTYEKQTNKNEQRERQSAGKESEV